MTLYTVLLLFDQVEMMRKVRNKPLAESEGSLHDLHDRTRRAAAVISKAKTRAMFDS